MTEESHRSETNADDQAGRESALSIRRNWWVAYALIFSIQVIAWTVIVVLEEVLYGGAHTRPSETAIAIGLKVGTLIVVCVAYTMILLEGVKSFMVISEYLRDKLNEKRKADEATRNARRTRQGARPKRRSAYPKP